VRKLALALLGFVLVAACRPFDIKTAPGFLELKEDSASYAYRATTPEGVVVAVRVVGLEGEGSDDLSFWTKALTLQMRDVSGYALLESHDVRSLDGVSGKQLRFGRDESGKPYVYWLTFFTVPGGSKLVIVEAGGAKATFENASPSVQWMIQSVRVK
jgi:hypothetical protein